MTPTEPSPSPEPIAPAPEADPVAPVETVEGDPAPDLRAVIPDNADGYSVNLSDDAKASLGLVENDPLVSALSKFAHENGKSQGWVDDAFEAAAALAANGLFDGGFDPAGETEKLGENGTARQREVETYAEALKTRGDIDEEEFGELMSLAPTAAGTRLIEKMRKWMGGNGVIQTGGNQVNAADAAKEEARAMANDPRYQTDRAFAAEADRKFKDAFKDG